MTNNFIIAANERQAQIEAAKAAFFMSGGQAKVCPGLPERVMPPVRKDWVDPETVLKRKRHRLRQSEAVMVRRIAEAL